jgi:hypothetical protein
MVETIIILLIVGVAGGVFYLMNRGSGRKPQHHTGAQHRPKPANRKKRTHTKAKSLDQLKQDKRIWGVEIKTPGCLEAYKLSREHYPIDSAPVLPLPNCPASDCTCTYSGLTEHRVRVRRIQGERRAKVRFDPKHPDRRTRKDRRRNVDPWKDRER